MSKYRPLSLDELKELEKEFIEFLVLNGITAEDWERIKKEDTAKANHIIDLFSDVVFESIMRKIQFLELRREKQIQTFQCLPDRLVLVGLTAINDNAIDFTNPGYIEEAVSNPPERLHVFTSERIYSKERELELFEMTEAGCTISDGKLFKTLCLALPATVKA
jgi:hypothetical protein